MDYRPRIGLIAGLDHEQRVRYYEWWRKYVWLGRAAGTCGLALLVCQLIVLSNGELKPIAQMLLKPAFGACAAFALWRQLMDCPRCGESFRSWYGKGYFGGECQNCGLTKRELSSIAKPQS